MLKREQISLPLSLRRLLDADRPLSGAVLLSVSDFEIWFADNKLVFFPEYTDHGPEHVTNVLLSAASLIPDEAWAALTPEDAAAITLSSLLHDCAMHLSEDGFLSLVTGEYPIALVAEKTWPDLWDSYLADASRFDGRTLFRLFGDTQKPRRPPLDSLEMTRRDRLLIGDFLRRHHPRLAHEIALIGVPGPERKRLQFTALAAQFRHACGMIARSHGTDLRVAVDWLPVDERRQFANVHVPYIMSLLRIADYIQIQSERAPKQTLLVRSLSSPVSRGEWRAHAAVLATHATHDDPEALFVKAAPPTAAEFVKLRSLLTAIQSELDATWAVLGEVFGRFKGLNEFGLTIRRLRSNLDDIDSFSREVSYVPRLSRFETAGADLLKLLVGPLYGSNPEIGVRELLQNALDAVRESRDLGADHAPAAIRVDVVTTGPTPVVIVSDTGCGMNIEVLTNYFLRAGASFRDSAAWRGMHTDVQGRSKVLRSGRFGIGALAAFLLGERINVSTKHYQGEEGYGFSASIDDDVIEIKRLTDRTQGTTVSVELSEDAADALSHERAWDWYCLADPRVVRRIDGKVLEQEVTWPAELSELPPEWRRLRHPDYCDIHWSCWRRVPEPSLVVNGLLVTPGNLYTYHGQPGDTLHPPSFSQINIRTPALSVFDPDGNLPLTLQRDALAVSQYPFAETLIDSVVDDLIGYVSVTAPADPAEIGEWVRSEMINYPLLWLPAIAESTILLLPFWCTPSGWSLLDAEAFRIADPKRLVVAMRPKPEAIGFSTIDFNREHVVVLNIQRYSTQAANAWLRFCLGGVSAGLEPLSGVQWLGATIAMTAEWFERISARGGIARALLSNVVRHQRVGEWVVIIAGDAESEPSARDFLSLADSKQPLDENDGFAEINCRIRRVNTLPLSPIAERWQRSTVNFAIPYGSAERGIMMRHARVTESADAYRNLISSGRLHRGRVTAVRDGT